MDMYEARQRKISKSRTLSSSRQQERQPNRSSIAIQQICKYQPKHYQCSIMQFARYKVGDYVEHHGRKISKIVKIENDGEVSSYQLFTGEIITDNDISKQVEANSMYDSLISQMENSTISWGNGVIAGISNPLEQKKPFYKWLYRNADEEPRIMNCWEGILYSAFQIGLISKEKIKELIKRKVDKSFTDPPILLDQIKDSSRTWTFEKDKELPNIPKGMIICWGEGKHFALSAGERNCIQIDKKTPKRDTISNINNNYIGENIYWGYVF